MANVTLSSFPSQTAMTDATIIPTVYSNLNYQISGANLLPYFQANIPGGNITGEVANATYANTSGSSNSVAGANVTGIVANAAYAGNAAVAFSVDGANVSGQVSDSATLQGYQTSNTAVANTITLRDGSGNIAANYFIGNGSQLTGFGNIVSTNFTGNGSTLLAGNGAWIAQAAAYGNANVAAYLPTNDSNVSGNNFTVSGNITAGSLGSPQQLLSYTANATTVTFDLMGAFPPPFSAGQTMQVYGITAGGPTELNGYWPVVSCDGIQVVITCNLQPTLPLDFNTFGRVADITNISTTGNVSGAYFLGNGAFLTGLASSYGDANVETLLASGNVTTDIVTQGNIVSGGDMHPYGNLLVSGNFDVSGLLANVQHDLTVGGISNVGTLNAVGAISLSNATPGPTVGQLIIDDTTVYLGQGNVGQGLRVDANAITLSGTLPVNIAGGAGAPINLTTVSGNVNFTAANTNLGNVSTVKITGGSTGQALTTDGTGNLSWATPAAGYSDANVETLLASGNVTSNIITTGNISAAYLIGTLANGTSNVSIPVTDGNVNVTVNGVTPLVATQTGITVSGNIDLMGGDIYQTPNNDLTISVDDPTNDGYYLYNAVNDNGVPVTQTRVGYDSFTVSTDVQGAVKNWSFDVSGNLNVPGNISGLTGADISVYAVDDGLTGSAELKSVSYAGFALGSNIRASQQNATISTANAAYTWTFDNTGNLTAPGDISANYFIGNGSLLTGLPDNYTDANVETLLASGNVTSNIITTANISAAYFIGNGSQLTGLPDAYSNANVAAYLPTYTGNIGANVITATTFSAGTGNVEISNNVIGTAAANLVIDPQMDGSPLTGNLIVLGNLTVGGNLTYVDVSSATTSNLLWIAANGANAPIFASGGGLAVGPLGAYATFTFGEAGNVWESSLGITATGNVTAPYFIGNGSALTSITGANVTGTVANATFATGALTAATVTTAAQPNITSVGTLSALDVSGNLTANNAAISNRLLVSSGNSLAPSIAFSADGAVDTGFYWVNDGVIGVTTNSQQRAEFNGTGLNVVGNVTTSNITATGTVSIANWTYVPQLWFKGTLSSSQALTSNADTTILYNTNADPLSWGTTAGSNGRIVPNKAGWYEITSRVELGQVNGNTQAQINHQILVNGGSVAISQTPNSATPGSGVPIITTAWVQLNGTTDYITTSCYTTIPGQQCVGGISTLLTIKWIST